jgi:undecaprenyl-diphosphatase
MRGLSDVRWLGGVALVAFVGLGVLVHGEPAFWIDRAAFDVIDPLRGDTGLQVVRVLTDIGSLPAAALVTVAAAIHVARTRGAATAVGLFAALLVAFALVHLGKELTDRARPDTRFYDPEGLSYPSGHSAYATAWLAAAALTGRRALIVAATILVLAVGMSRLYLHVHHLTDVVGGFAVGAAVYLPVLARR